MIRITFISFIFSTYLMGLQSCSVFNKNRMVIPSGQGVVAWVDSKDRLVNPKDVDALGEFSEGLVAAKRDSLWGFMNSKGKWSILPKYEDVQAFSEGFAPAKYDGAWGFLDINGNWKIKPKFQKVHGFSEGLAWVQKSNKEFYINTKGIVVIPRVAGGNDFHHGFASVKFGEKWGFINKSGNMIPSVSYSKTGDFTDDLAPVLTDSGWGYINQKGHLKIPGKYANARNFYRERAVVLLKNDRWTFIDLDGEEYLSDYEEVKDYAENGLAAVSVKGKWGFINDENEFVIPAIYGDVCSFKKQGGQFVAWVQSAKIRGFINSDGEAVFNMMTEIRKKWKKKSQKIEKELRIFAKKEAQNGQGPNVNLEFPLDLKVSVKSSTLFRKGKMIIGAVRLILSAPKNDAFNFEMHSDIQNIYLWHEQGDSSHWEKMKSFSWERGRLGKEVEKLFREHIH